MSLPWPDLTAGEWEQVLAEEAAKRQKDLTDRDYVRDEAGRFAETGRLTFRRPTGDDAAYLKAADPETRLLPNDLLGLADKTDGGKVALVKQRGSAVPPSPELLTQVFGTKNAVDLVGQMVKDLPGPLVQVHMTEGEYPDTPGAAVVDVYIRSGKLYAQRQFIRDRDGTLRVHHDSFVVPKHAQGTGIAKTFLADSVRAYQAAGVDKVDTLANIERGAYAWAKFGFTADDPEVFADKVLRRIEKAGDGAASPVLPDATPDEKADLTALVRQYRSDPKLPWHLANAVTGTGQKVGKDLLYEMDYKASLDLKDPEAMGKFHSYVKGK